MTPSTFCSSVTASRSGPTVTPADTAFAPAVAAAETTPRGGVLSAGIIAGSVFNRSEEIAAGQANYGTKGNASPAAVVSAPWSPDDLKPHPTSWTSPSSPPPNDTE
jgi:hypothetical protein